MIDISSLNEVFKVVFQNEDLLINRKTTADDVEGWDSLSHVILITAIEDEYGISFSQREIFKFRCVGDILDLVNQKLNLK